MQGDLFQFKKIWKISPFGQISLVIILFLATVFHGSIVYKETGLTQWGFPLNPFIYFAPFYEEIIFRGFIFGTLLKNTSPKKAIVYSSILFGVWHFKNIFFLDPITLTKQILYTGLFFGPILAYITYKTRTIWPAVILHLFNNFWSPFSFLILEFFLKL